MTEPSVYAEDVSKLKDSDEIKQAYVGLKDTNRYFVTDSTPPNLQIHTFIIRCISIHIFFQFELKKNEVEMQKIRKISKDWQNVFDFVTDIT